MASPTFSPLPVTIPSSFLGAGKPALLQRLLANTSEETRGVVLENESGGGAVDDELFAGARPPVSRMVFIGRDLDRGAIRRGLAECQAGAAVG